MPRLEDAEQSLLSSGSNLKQRTQNAWDSFSDFALRDNVLEVAVGLILAAAFTTVVTSFVSDIILPPISLLPFFSRNLEEKFAVLKQGPNYRAHDGYNTPKQAKDDGAVVMNYGAAAAAMG
ncbi:MAG: hypothetical protein LQ352_004180 [Teloschistes flavicans]|nr:MAG: hypothetical protein LQ352_004180 [Teloschistes flavicans]